uniref:FAD-dependent oxidoreductase n=1 Tax=Caldiarchaeum subterraneum TaxID=311458 RepID=E6NA37_CALS0|nr:hypothetical protein HGMM_F51A06C36 [Candidatus Caldarchaeum subterraneum]
MYDSVIVGGGLTGLCIGIKLRQLGEDVVILEKADHVGGHASSIKIGQYWMDFGPHIFRLTSERLKNYYNSFLKADFRIIKSNPKIYKYGTYFDHVIPCITRKNIEILSKLKGFNHTFEFVSGKSGGENFEEYLISSVGKDLYWEFFGEYSQKWWGVPPSLLDVCLAPKNIYIGDVQEYSHYTIDQSSISNVVEVYPRVGGFQSLANQLNFNAEKSGVLIVTHCNVSRVDCNINSMEVAAQIDDKEITFKTRKVYLTCPIDVVAKILNIKKPNLDYRGILFGFIHFQGETSFEKYSWTYLHETRFLAGRVYDARYYCEPVASKNDEWTAICIEIPMNIDYDHYTQNNATHNLEILEHECLRAFEQLVDESLVKITRWPSADMRVKTHYHRYSYPLLIKGYQKVYLSFQEEVSSLSEKIKLEGRNARFEYLNSNNIIDRYLLSNWPYGDK